jgi:hypothetical protein
VGEQLMNLVTNGVPCERSARSGLLVSAFEANR